MKKNKNVQSKSKNTRSRPVTPTNVAPPNVQASSGSFATSVPKPVAKSNQHPSHKRTKISDDSTMDVDSPAPTIHETKIILTFAILIVEIVEV